MRIESIELKQLEIPMVEPMAAAYGTVSSRRTTFVHLVSDIGEGWGECVALNEPLYAPDWSDGEFLVLEQLMAPTLLSEPIVLEQVWKRLSLFAGHNPAKAALEMAVLDAQLRHEGQSLAQHFDAGRNVVDCACVVGLSDGDEMVKSVGTALDAGYKSIKLKIKPGADTARIELLREELGEFSLRVDANGSYKWDRPNDRRALLELGASDLTLIEQPFPAERSEWTRLFKAKTSVPLALDESLFSEEAAKDVIESGLCDVLILKPGMLGGYLTAQDLIDESTNHDMPTTVGGMVETSLGRAANLALAAITDVDEYPAEISADGRWFADSFNVEPVSLRDGQIKVPNTPGVVGELDTALIDKYTVRSAVVRN